ncbi:MAG: hypothetical protein EBZ77_12985, partial [Chitinophagia bacterium]|nr:hypothetical protein [Chitinophagia bacterium]
FDPYYNHDIITRFVKVLQKGEDSGVQWRGIVMQRFELQQQALTRGMEGLQHIAPERFRGFMFVRDMLSATTFCITITEIQKINGFYCGGQVLNVIEAKSIDEYIYRENLEQRDQARQAVLDDRRRADSIRMADSMKAIVKVDTPVAPKPKGLVLPVDTARARKQLLLNAGNTGEEEGSKGRREVVDRKFYRGKFDDDILVELYVRYMKDVKGKVTNWDGLYKFGDMEDYVKLEISRSDGKWLFEEPVGVMELELLGKTYSGSWTNGGQTGYDAELTQKEISQRKIELLDKILDNGWGKTSDQVIKERPDTVAKKTVVTEDTTKKEDTDAGKKVPEKKDEPADKPAEKKKDTDAPVKPRPKKEDDDEE